MLHRLAASATDSAYATIHGTVEITDDPADTFHQVVGDDDRVGRLGPRRRRGVDHSAIFKTSEERPGILASAYSIASRTAEFDGASVSDAHRGDG